MYGISCTAKKPIVLCDILLLWLFEFSFVLFTLIDELVDNSKAAATTEGNSNPRNGCDKIKFLSIKFSVFWASTRISFIWEHNVCVYRTYVLIASLFSKYSFVLRIDENSPQDREVEEVEEEEEDELDDDEKSFGTRLIQSSRWYKLTAGNNSTFGRFSNAVVHIKSEVEIDKVPRSVSRRNLTIDWFPNPDPKSEATFARPCHRPLVPIMPHPNL